MKLPTTLIHNHPDVYQGDVQDTEGHPIIQVQDQWGRTALGQHMADARAEANAGRQAIAAEVVLRWNLHEEMVTLLRGALKGWSEGDDLFSPMMDVKEFLKKLDQP